MCLLLKSMRNPQTALSMLVVASSVICIPIGGYCRQFTVIFVNTPSPAGAATTQQAPGSAKTLSTATPSVMPSNGNGTPQSQHKVNLTWKASTATSVKYNVYRSSKEGECLKAKSKDCQKISPTLVPSNSYTDSTVQTGHRYFYVVKAVSLGGPESGPSNEAQAVISSH
jgi:hypothetical protein